MNEAPRGVRPHISFFGLRNAGKSSLVNALAGQPVSMVSDTPGTTADPVFKSMELLPAGPVVLVDTAGLDDEGELGNLRVQRAMDIVNRTDLAVLVCSPKGPGPEELEIYADLASRKIPVVLVANKADDGSIPEEVASRWVAATGVSPIPVSALTGLGVSKLKGIIAERLAELQGDPPLVADLVGPGDIVVMVVPIDKAAPKGRLILPQQQVIRDVLESDATAVVTKEHELRMTLESLNKRPSLVITDSQVFQMVAADTPPEVPMTSFSILLARQKGDLSLLSRGYGAVKDLKPGDAVLIAEGCTHHRQSDDIGTVKIPRYLRQIAGGDLDFEWASGHHLPEDLSRFSLIVHCGACMLNRQEFMGRLMAAKDSGIPIVNYGVLLGGMQGVLPRALRPFPGAMIEAGLIPR